MRTRRRKPDGAIRLERELSDRQQTRVLHPSPRGQVFRRVDDPKPFGFGRLLAYDRLQQVRIDTAPLEARQRCEVPEVAIAAWQSNDEAQLTDGCFFGRYPAVGDRLTVKQAEVGAMPRLAPRPHFGH